MTTLKERCVNLPQFDRQGVRFVPYWGNLEGLFLLCEVSRIAKDTEEFEQFFSGDINFYPYYMKPSGFHPDLSKFVGRLVVSQYDETYWSDEKIVASLIKAADEISPIVKTAVEKRKVWISRPVEDNNQYSYSDRSFDRWSGWRLDRDEE